MSTIREWLTDEEFDWESGTIVWQNSGELEEDRFSVGWSDRLEATIISHDHPILDYEFDSGYGAPECPRFVAKDKEKVYFPWQYDGATGIDFVWLDMDKYLDFQNNPTPYPGG